MAIKRLRGYSKDPNFLLNYLSDFNISEKIDTLYFTLSFSNSNVSNKRILKLEKKSGHEVTKTDLVLNNTWSEPFEFLKRTYLKTVNEAFYAQCYDDTTVGFFYIPAKVPRKIDYSNLFERGDKLILSYIGDKVGRKLFILTNDEVDEKFDGFEEYHPINLINSIDDRPFNCIPLKRVNIQNNINDSDYINLVASFCDGHITEVELLKELLKRNNLKEEEITLSGNKIEYCEGFILDVHNSNKIQIMVTPNQYIESDDMSAIKMYYDVFLNNFIKFLGKYTDTIECVKMLRDPYKNYIDSVSDIFVEYINQLDKNEFADYDLTADMLQLPLNGHRGDINYTYIKNGYCKTLLMTNELYKNMYLIVLSSLRFYKTPDTDVNSMLSSDDYLVWNRLVQNLSKKQR